LTILPALLQRGAVIRAHDPQGMDEAARALPDSIDFTKDIDSAVRGADAVVLLTEWNQYRGLPLEHVRSLMRGNVFVDLRNVYERDLMEGHGFQYHCIGR